MLKHELAEDYIFQQRFNQEARAAAEVHDEHLVPIIEAGEADGTTILAVAYLLGRVARRPARRGRPASRRQTRRGWSRGRARPRRAARAGIVHRDVKPGNVLFDADGTAKLTDFGLAKGRAYTVLTQPGQVIGTLDYLAPELIRGEPATPVSDLYALGCVAYECVVGTAPFADKTFFEIGIAHLEEAPVDPREQLPGAAAGALRRDPRRTREGPANRPASAGAFADLLGAAEAAR